MGYKPKVKHVVSDMEDGDFKTKEDYITTLSQFSKDELVDFLADDFNNVSDDNLVSGDDEGNDNETYV